MSIQPTREVDYRGAEIKLIKWLKCQSMGIMNCREWNYWNYNTRPFWSVWGMVYGIGNKVIADYCGIQIYDDGEIDIVAKNIYSEVWNEHTPRC